MSEETKVAVRLLLRCMDELRKHDTGRMYMTDPQLKADLRMFFAEHKITSPAEATDILCTR